MTNTIEITTNTVNVVRAVASTATPIERVDAGARFLDRVVSDWYARVDLDRLDVATHDTCVLAQVFDRPYKLALRAVIKGHVVEGRPFDFAVYHGFAVDYSDRFRVGSIAGLFRLLNDR